jgi:7-cyano-7-deazaguanine synthase
MRAMTPSSSKRATVGLLLSGGLDSAILLGQLLAGGRTVRPFYVRSQLVWQQAELRAVRALLRAMRRETLEPLVVLDMPLGDLYGDHWSTTGKDTPRAGTPDEAVYLPGRNLLLALKPALWCAMHGIEELALAVLAANPFSDATTNFFRDFEAAIRRATGNRVRMSRPFDGLEKTDVLTLGRELPLKLTFSCIAPVDNLHCGRCNKCDERQQAFRRLGEKDPTIYAHKTTNHKGGRGKRVN